MTFEFLPVTDFYRHFGDGYCVELPSDEKLLDTLLDFLSACQAAWKYYATLVGGNWVHGIHLTFADTSPEEAGQAMREVCKMLGAGSYGCYDAYMQSVVDADGEVIAFADMSE